MAKRTRKDSDLRIEDQSIPVSSTPFSSPQITETLVSDPQVKVRHVDSTELPDDVSPVIICSLSGHREPIQFQSYEEYETHYNKAHVNRCAECRKNFPTAYLLTIHIEENHDTLIAARRDRGEQTFSCFVEGCDRKCLTPQKRRLHMIDKHMFPRDYDFRIVDDGIDNRTSMLLSGRPPKQGFKSSRHESRSLTRNSSRPRVRDSPQMESGDERTSRPIQRTQMLAPASEQQTDDVDSLSTAMSALRFVPPSVRLRQAKSRERSVPASISKRDSPDHDMSG